MKSIGVVIPVIRQDTFTRLMRCIATNSILPRKITIINNTGAALAVPKMPSNIWLYIYAPKSPLGVNPSWNIGFRQSMTMDLITVLNDDVMIEHDFFKKLRIASEFYRDGAAFCPLTLVEEGPLNSMNGCEGVDCERMTRREGWAYTIRRDCLKDVPVIPAELNTFFGDDWLFFWTTQIQKKKWYRMKNVLAFHRAGISVTATETLKKERAIFKQLVSNL